MIGFVIAMDSEAELLFRRMQTERFLTLFGKTVRVGKLFGQDVIAVLSAEGKVHAAAGACAALAAGADLIVNCGVAGGLNGRTKVGGVYVIERAVQYDFDLRQLTGKEVGTLPGEETPFLPLFVPSSLDLERRTLGTGDRFDDSPADHALLLRLGCDIRDMETGAVAQVCRGAGVPLCSVKAISDVYGSGATTEQFRANLGLALRRLEAHLPALVEALTARA